MKTLLKTTLLLAFSFLLISGSCKKEKTGTDGLPAATQEGKNTFGCLVNGKAFVAKWYGFPPKSGVACQYGYIDYNVSTTDHYFNVRGTDNKTDPNKYFDVKIFTHKLDMMGGGGYILFKTSKTVALMLNMR
jgi:hypothetical protein